MYLVLFLAIRGWGRELLTEELSCPNALGTSIDDSQILQMRAGDILNRQVINVCESYYEPGTIPGPGACNSKQTRPYFSGAYSKLWELNNKQR